MKRLYPDVADNVDPADELAGHERQPPPGRPWVMVNMIAAVDGAATVDGLSGGLGGAPDKKMFRALRALPDAIMAASGTVLAESYGPSRPEAAVRAARRVRGQSEVPPIAVVTGSLGLEWDADFFTDAESQPIVITTEDADAERRAEADRVAKVITAGKGRVDLTLALAALAEQGVGFLLVEGGPGLNGQMLREGLVDELNLTVAPLIVGGGGTGILSGPPPDVPLRMTLAGVLEEEDFLFLRYLRSG